MFKSVFVLLSVSGAVLSNNDEKNNKEYQYQHVISIENTTCSSRILVLHEGTSWVLVKANFHIEDVHCYMGGHKYANEFNWRGQTQKIPFPESGVILIYWKNVTKSLNGWWHCMFIRPRRENINPPACNLHIQVRGGNDTRDVFPKLELSLPLRVEGFHNTDAPVLWICIIAGLVTFVIVLAGVIVFYRRKIQRLETELTTPLPPPRPPVLTRELTKPKNVGTFRQAHEYDSVYSHQVTPWRKFHSTPKINLVNQSPAPPRRNR